MTLGERMVALVERDLMVVVVVHPMGLLVMVYFLMETMAQPQEVALGVEQVAQVVWVKSVAVVEVVEVVLEAELEVLRLKMVRMQLAWVEVAVAVEVM